MSAESHKKYLERRALQAAQKAIDRHGREGFAREDFASLRIQTVEPWKRALLAFLGLSLCGAGFYALREDSKGLAVFLFVGAFLAFLAAIFGVMKTVEGVLKGVDIIRLFETLF